MRGGVRRGSCLFLRLARISLSRVRLFLLDWAASCGCTLDSGALHVRFRPGDIQLLRPDQPRRSEHGLSQRAPRFAVDTLEQSAEAARDGPGILRSSEVPHLVDSIAFTVYF